MSRSYRRPYCAVCGVGTSAKEDKVLAHRGVRRVHNHLVRLMLKDPCLNIPLPHFRSCPWNNVYSWSRDGHQRLCVPTARDWDRHMKAVLGIGYEASKWGRRFYLPWPPPWYAEYCRK